MSRGSGRCSPRATSVAAATARPSPRRRHSSPTAAARRTSCCLPISPIRRRTPSTNRSASKRSTTLEPFDVQLQGALRMLAGDVVEMATGEGKTLSGAIAAAGYALAGRNVHVITINDYLARRDAEWMGPLIEALGLTVGWITADSTADERRETYKCNITYASVNEIGFDVLRDQLVTDVDDLVSPNPDVALIDEADSVLVDEALVPLVLAGTSHRETPKVEIIRLVGELIAGKDYDT